MEKFAIIDTKGANTWIDKFDSRSDACRFAEKYFNRLTYREKLNRDEYKLVSYDDECAFDECGVYTELIKDFLNPEYFIRLTDGRDLSFELEGTLEDICAYMHYDDITSFSELEDKIYEDNYGMDFYRVERVEKEAM